MRLLLVEDDPVVAIGLVWALSEHGHHVVHSDSARPVPGLIVHHQPDAIIVDVSLPDISGLDLVTMLRKSWPELPVIFATGHDETDRMRESIDSWTAYLQKPFSVDALHDALARIVPGARFEQ